MFKVLSIGEVLWDLFPDYKKPGGSPANLAYHIHCLGNESLLLSRVGTDTEGEELVRFLQDKGLSTRFVQQDRTDPTGRVTVHVRDGDGEPSYTIHEPSAWDSIEITEELLQELPELDAVCFASLSQRNRRTAGTVQKLLLQAPDACKKVFDLNLRPPFTDKETIIRSMELADIIKMNEEELDTVSGWFGKTDLPNHLISTWPGKVILITYGAEGSVMYSQNGQVCQEAFPVTGRGDFVGVGDAFLACFTHLMLHGTPEQELLEKAGRYAAYVASRQGGMPAISSEVKKLVSG